MQSRVDDDRTSQTHGLALSSKRHAKRINNVSLEVDAVLGHWAICKRGGTSETDPIDNHIHRNTDRFDPETLDQNCIYRMCNNK